MAAQGRMRWDCKEAMVQGPLSSAKSHCEVSMSILYTEYKFSNTLSTEHSLCRLIPQASSSEGLNTSCSDSTTGAPRDIDYLRLHGIGEPLFGVKHMGEPFVGWDNAFLPGVNE